MTAPAPTGNRLLVVSSDAHASPPIRVYREFLAKKHHDQYDDYASMVEAYDAIIEAEAPPKTIFPPLALIGSGGRRHRVAAFTNGGEGMPGLWEPDERLLEFEDEGIAAEVIFPQGSIPFHPYPARNPMGRPGIAFHADDEMLFAGIRAYNRWLAQLCNAHPGRRVGVAVVPIDDVGAAVSEVEWARQAGLTSVSVPPVLSDRLYNDPKYEPFWAACESLEMPLSVHGGGRRDFYGSGPETLALILAETDWYVRRTLWFLIFAGVFERHQELKLVFTEQRAHWVPPLLEELDSIYVRCTKLGSLSLPRQPSEYFAQSCYIGASFLSRREATMRHAIGRDRLMWGSDYPHNEGTWPWSLDSIRMALSGLPAEDIRLILGENAVRCYGMDQKQLQEVANRIGPTLEDVNRPLETVPEGSDTSWGFRESVWH